MTAAEANDNPTSDDAVMQSGAIVFDHGSFIEPAAPMFSGPGGARTQLRPLTAGEGGTLTRHLLGERPDHAEKAKAYDAARTVIVDGWHNAFRQFVAAAEERDDAERVTAWLRAVIADPLRTLSAEPPAGAPAQATWVALRWRTRGVAVDPSEPATWARGLTAIVDAARELEIDARPAAGRPPSLMPEFWVGLVRAARVALAAGGLDNQAAASVLRLPTQATLSQDDDEERFEPKGFLAFGILARDLVEARLAELAAFSDFRDRIASKSAGTVSPRTVRDALLEARRKTKN